MQHTPRKVQRVRSLDGFVQQVPARHVRPQAAAQHPASRSMAVPRHRPQPLKPVIHGDQKLSPNQLSEYFRNPGQARSPQTRQPVRSGTMAQDGMLPHRRHTADTPRKRPAYADVNAASILDREEPKVRRESPQSLGKESRRSRKKTRKHPKLRRFALSTAGIVGALIMVAGGWLGWKFFNNTGKVFGGNIISNIGGLVNSTPLKGQETGRVNILLAGNSSDDTGHNGAALTDSIMLISIDTNNNKAFMLSIPRDFWVNIPGVGYRKINEANYWGDQKDFSENGYPSGGMGLLEKTVESSLGVNVNYYALINYGAFRDAVDAVGGITVNITSDDPRGLYDPTFQRWEGGPLKLSNGPHELNGITALKLARARGHDGGYGYATSDFTRTENQRKMLIALKEKSLSSGVLSNPIKIGSLMDSIGNNVKTDFKINEITTLAGIGKKINTIDSLSFQDKNTKLLSSYTSPTGQSALIPSAGVGEYGAINAFLKQHMSSDPVVQEAAHTVIYNGTQTDGLAKGQQAIFQNKGLYVDSIAGASKTYEKTTIIDASAGGKKATKAWLLKAYPGATVVTEAVEKIPTGVQFVVILGNDFAAKQAASTSATQ